MARLITCGWETGRVDEVGSVTEGNPSHHMTVETTLPTGSLTTPHGGDRALHSYVMATLSPATCYVQVPLAANTADLWVRCYFKYDETHACFQPPPVGVLKEHWAFTLRDAAANELLSLRWHWPNQTLRAYILGSTGWATGTLVGTTPAMISDWNLIQVHLVVGASGSLSVWLNGVEVVTYSGDTQGANTATRIVELGTRLGFDTIGQPIQDYPYHLYYDDLAINDTSGSLNSGKPADAKIVFLQPTGAGASTAWARGGTDSGANWNQVDEIPPNTADYVQSNVGGQRDLYALENLPSTATGVSVVDVVCYEQNPDGGAIGVAGVVKSGATILPQTPQVGTGAWRHLHFTFDADPATGAAWTVAAVNALEAGLDST